MDEQALLDRATKLLSRITPCPLPLPLRPIHNRIPQLRATEDWGEWCEMPGVYYFVHQGEVVYVGRAVPSQGLGNRVGTHIAPTDDSEWSAVIEDPETVVGVIPFPNEDWHWAATLEFWLIDPKVRPKFNKRF